jgi:hypothetical protein
MAVRRHDAKSLFHDAPPSLAGGYRLPPCIPGARPRAETKKIRTKSLTLLDSAPEMQQIAAKSDGPAGIPC